MVKTRRRPTHPGVAFKMFTFPEFNMTQEEYADYIGISRNTLSNILNGKARVTPDIAHRFGKTVNSDGVIYLRMQAEYDLWELQQTACDIKPIINAA